MMSTCLSLLPPLSSHTPQLSTPTLLPALRSTSAILLHPLRVWRPEHGRNNAHSQSALASLPFKKRGHAECLHACIMTSQACADMSADPCSGCRMVYMWLRLARSGKLQTLRCVFSMAFARGRCQQYYPSAILCWRRHDKGAISLLWKLWNR